MGGEATAGVAGGKLDRDGAAAYGRTEVAMDGTEFRFYGDPDSCCASVCDRERSRSTLTSRLEGQKTDREADDHAVSVPGMEGK